MELFMRKDLYDSQQKDVRLVCRGMNYRTIEIVIDFPGINVSKVQQIFITYPKENKKVIKFFLEE